LLLKNIIYTILALVNFNIAQKTRVTISVSSIKKTIAFGNKRYGKRGEFIRREIHLNMMVISLL
jgi:hypothetical protein